MREEWLPTAIEWLPAGFAFLFFLSSWSKSLSFRAFVGSVRAFNLLPARYAKHAAAAVLTIEIALAFGLATIVPARPLWIAAGTLLSGFTIALYLASRQGTIVECSCFGGRGRATRLRLAMLRNVALLALCVWGAAAAPLQAFAVTSFDTAFAALEAALLVSLVSQWRRFARREV